MKKITVTLFLNLAVSYLSFSQNMITYFQNPPGYTFYEYAVKSDFAMLNDSVGWFGFRNIGLGKYNAGIWIIHDSLNSPLPGNLINAVEPDGSGNIWAGTNYGLVKFDGTNWTIYNSSNSGLSNDTVLSIRFNGSDLWTGTKQGAFIFDGTIWTNYNTSNSGIIGNEVRAFAFKSTGEAWIGTKQGLSKFYNNTWTDFTFIYNSTNYNVVMSLEIDGSGDVWIGAAPTINLLPSQIFKIENGQVKIFINDFYTGIMTLGIHANSLCRNSAGDIFFFFLHGGFSGGIGVAEIAGSQIKYYYGPENAVNITSTGNFRAALDSQGNLWMMPRSQWYMGADSAFYNYDFKLNPISGNYITVDNYKFLDVNDVKCGILNRGDMHWNGGNLGPGNGDFSQYFVPKNSGKTSVFVSSLWIGGLDAGGNIRAAAQSYRQTGQDYWPGPIDGMSVPFSPYSCQQFDKIWKVDRFSIEDFKYHFLDGSVSNGTYPVPDEILTWPAKGNGIVTGDLAPYVDFNSNGSYNPFDGDYPLIKGDQMLWWVFNDLLPHHPVTNSLPLGFQIQGSAYSYTCPPLPDSNYVMNWTTFYNYKIINKSSSDYNNVYLGLWSDTDMGFYQDDYVGCDSALDVGFTYNGDAIDDLPAGYGANPPMQNIAILKGPLADVSDGLDNDHDGTIDEPGERCSMNHFLYYNNSSDPISGEPGYPLASPSNFYSYLSGYWMNGVHVTYGGTGYGGTIPTNYMFSGTPYSGTGWSEITMGNVPHDRRMLLSSGPFSLAPGQETTIDFAYVFTWDSTAANGLTTSIARNTADLQRIKHWFDIDSFPSCLLLNVGVNQMEEGNNLLNIYPNPANDKLYVEFSSNHSSENTYEVIDLPGRILMNEKLKSNFIDIRQLPKGLYILQWHNGDKIYRKKFVKQ